MTNELTTFMDLKKMIPKTDWTKLLYLYDKYNFFTPTDEDKERKRRVPTTNMLSRFNYENDISLIGVYSLASEMVLKVYDIGLVAYETYDSTTSRLKFTVFELHEYSDYVCTSLRDYKGESVINSLYMSPWYIALHMIAEEHREHNLARSGKLVSYDGVSQDWKLLEDYSSTDAFDALINKEIIDEILSLLNNKRQAEALFLYYCDEQLTQTEIAERMKTSQQNVSYLLRSGISALQKILNSRNTRIRHVRHNKVK